MMKSNNIKSLSFQMILNVSVMLILVNIFVITNIAFWVRLNIENNEKVYMSEVLAKKSVEISSELQRYIDATQAIAKNGLVIQYLETTPDIGLIVHDQVAQDGIRQELKTYADLFGETVLFVAIGSMESDNLIDHVNGGRGEGFYLSTRPYYNAITENRTVITEAYPDFNTGDIVVSIVHPVYGLAGNTIGLICFDVYVEKLDSFVDSTTFGNTGKTYLLDTNDTYLIQPPGETGDFSMNIYKGNEILAQFSNPTGDILNYTRNGVECIGGVLNIDSTGWTLISSIEVQDFQSQSDFLVVGLSVFQVLCFTFGIVMSGRYIYRKLTPIKMIQDYMHEISIGNLQSSLEYESDDEMGALVTDIKGMSDTLFSYITHIADTIHDFAEGKIQVNDSVEYIGDFTPIYDSMEDFVSLMTVSLSDLKHAVEEVSSGANQISDGANVLASGSQQQATSVEELNQLISTVNDEILETAKYSSKISAYADNLTRDILLNNDKMKILETNVQEIKDHSDEVKRIIKAIEDVAFQTNILALNAAVEAARAGESGRGFAIVADEVRNLSLKTSEAVQDTTKIITEMTGFVESSTDLAHETSKDLQHVANEAQAFVQNMASITHSTNDQSKAISDIHSGIEQISILFIRIQI